MHVSVVLVPAWGAALCVQISLCCSYVVPYRRTSMHLYFLFVPVIYSDVCHIDMTAQ